MKKVLAVILVVALVLSLGVITAFAASPPFNGDVTGIITSADGLNITGAVHGAYNLSITGHFTGSSGQRSTFTGTVAGDISGTVNGLVLTNGLDALYAEITGTGAADPVRIVGCFLQSGINGDFAGKIITGALPLPVTSLAITAAGDATTVAAGSALQMSAVTAPAGPYSVLWSVFVDDADKATIDQTGKLIGIKAGTVTVIANTLDPGLATAVKTITVVDPKTEVKAGVDPTYIITIPATVDFGTLVKSAAAGSFVTREFDVLASNVLIEVGAKIDVKVNSTFKMNDGDGTLLGYDLNNPGMLASGDKFASFSADGKQDGTISVDPFFISKAGAYSGTMTFGIEYVPAP